jgi:hypothetical protein
VKTAADVIAHASHGHAPQRLQRHRFRLLVTAERVGVQQEKQFGRPRKLRRTAEAAVARVE